MRYRAKDGHKKEFDYELTPDSNDEILIPDNMLQVDLNISSKRTGNRQFDSIIRKGKLYDRITLV